MKWQQKAAPGSSVKSPTSAARRSKKYFKIFSTDSKKCVIIEGFADRGEDDKTEDGLMAAERWWLSCLK